MLFNQATIQEHVGMLHHYNFWLLWPQKVPCVIITGSIAVVLEGERHAQNFPWFRSCHCYSWEQRKLLMRECGFWKTAVTMDWWYEAAPHNCAFQNLWQNATSEEVMPGWMRCHKWKNAVPFGKALKQSWVPVEAVNRYCAISSLECVCVFKMHTKHRVNRLNQKNLHPMATRISSNLHCLFYTSTVCCWDLKPSHGGVEIELWWLWIGGHESWHRTVGRPGITTKTLESNAKCSFSSFTHNTLFGHHPQPVCASTHNPRHLFFFFSNSSTVSD